VKIQLGKGANKETTYRSRSFLFAVLGVIVAQSFGRDRVSFYENGVVSLNLQPVANVVGTRATRTTHPQTLDLMTQFFERVSKRTAKIDNPYFWRTKTDVVQTIARLGLADQIRVTNSCADTRNRTEQHPIAGDAHSVLTGGLPCWRRGWSMRIQKRPMPSI
jgi:7-cyano-7-deazaguanine synthase in queuosine biosynthesis